MNQHNTNIIGVYLIIMRYLLQCKRNLMGKSSRRPIMLKASSGSFLLLEEPMKTLLHLICILLKMQRLFFKYIWNRLGSTWMWLIKYECGWCFERKILRLMLLIALIARIRNMGNCTSLFFGQMLTHVFESRVRLMYSNNVIGQILGKWKKIGYKTEFWSKLYHS